MTTKTDEEAWAEIDRDIARRNARVRAQETLDKALAKGAFVALFAALIYLGFVYLSH